MLKLYLAQASDFQNRALVSDCTYKCDISLQRNMARASYAPKINALDDCSFCSEDGTLLKHNMALASTTTAEEHAYDLLSLGA